MLSSVESSGVSPLGSNGQFQTRDHIHTALFTLMDYKTKQDIAVIKGLVGKRGVDSVVGEPREGEVRVTTTPYS